MKRRMIYLGRGGGGRYSARVGYGPVDGPIDTDHWYHPTPASARRLAKIMERILNRKQFWTVNVTPHDLMILLQRVEPLAPKEVTA